MSSADSVVLEIQVDKEILRQLLLANKNFSFEHSIKLDENVRQLTEENAALKESQVRQQELNRELQDENFLLRSTIKDLEVFRRVVQEKDRCGIIETTENKLMKLKLQSLESEKTTIIRDFEREKDLFDQMLCKNNKMAMHQEKLRELEKNLNEVNEELRTTKGALEVLREENHRLDEDKLKLEEEVRMLKRKVRLMEQKTNALDLEQVESKLLKLKLQSVENEKQYLLADFERERKIMGRRSMSHMEKMEGNLRNLRNWIEREARERRPSESPQVKLLKSKVEGLEEERRCLIEGFELERKVFGKILRDYGLKNDLL